MSKIDDGGPAYPVITWRHPDGFCIGSMEHGLTKREAFAMAAMQGLISNSAWNDNFTPAIANMNADAAVMLADAILAALRGDANG